MAATVALVAERVTAAPTFTSVPPTTAEVGREYRYELKAVAQSTGGGGGDDGGEDKGRAISYAAPILPAWLKFEHGDRLKGTPRVQDIGAHSVRVTASNNTGTAVQDFQILVTAPNAGDLPVIGTADIAAGIAVAPNPVSVGDTAVWTFSVENRSPADIANVSLRAELAAGSPLALEAPSHAGCSLLPSGSQTVVDCRLGPLKGRATERVSVAGTAGSPGDVRGTVTVSISDRVPIDIEPGNNVAGATLSVTAQAGVGPVQQLSVADARASVAGDLNGDGATDLAVVTGTNVLAFAGGPDASDANKRMLATQGTSIAQAPASLGIAAADLDGDGDLDLVVANGAGVNDLVLLNSGEMRFAASPLGASTTASRDVAIGDLDGDGLLDIVFANAQQSTVYRNSGGGTFTPAGNIAETDTRDVVIANLFGDALPEIVFANANADAAIYRRTGAGYERAATLATGPARSVAAADLDNDGDLDLVFGRAGGGAGSSHVYRNDSTTTPAFTLSDELASTAIEVLTADFDGDGDVDVVTISSVGGHQLHFNDGGASVTFTPHQERFVAAGARSAALGKIGIDDRDDVVVTSSTGIAIFFNDGRGNLGAGDTGAPTLTLRGDPNIGLTVGIPYQDAGATATDEIDGDLTSKISVENPVDTAVIGTYTVTYRVVDSSGNSAAPVTRSVEVQTQTGTGGGGGGSVGIELLLLLLLVRRRARGR